MHCIKNSNILKAFIYVDQQLMLIKLKSVNTIMDLILSVNLKNINLFFLYFYSHSFSISLSSETIDRLCKDRYCIHCKFARNSQQLPLEPNLCLLILWLMFASVKVID